MKSAAFAWLVVLTVPVFAGCFESAPAASDAAANDAEKKGTATPIVPSNLTILPKPTPRAELLPAIKVGALAAHGTSALLARLPAIHARPDGYNAPCDPGNCLLVPFEVKFAENYWQTHTGALEVSLAWGGHESIDFGLWLEDEAGEVLAEGSGGEYATVILLPNAASGRYIARILATEAGGDPTLVLQVESRPIVAGEAPRELLPNLVALVPKDLSLTSNNYFLDELGRFKRQAYRAAGVGSCGLDEMVEGRAKRCLRFATGIGNVGDGPLEVHLAFPNDFPAIVGRGQFQQRIYSSDGTWRDEPTGAAEYHPTHRHLHYNGLAHFQLFAYDLEAGARGAPAGEGRKAGFCMVDEGLVEAGALGTVPSNYTGLNCDFLDPMSERLMRITQGWFDMYEVNRPDQYIEITGLPDGVYELVATANGGGTILESNPDDNEASVVFRLAGDAIEILENRGRPGPFDG